MADKQSVGNADIQLNAVVAATRYVTLHTGRDPTSANEVSGNAYARQTIAGGTGGTDGFELSTVDGYRRVANRAAINFPSPNGGNWGTNGGCMALWDGVPGTGSAKWLFYVDLNADIADGATVQVAAGAFGYEIALSE